MPHEIYDTISKSIKNGLDFDGDSFFFNKGQILTNMLKPTYEQLGINEEKMSFEEFQKNIEEIGDELARDCTNSSIGKDLIKDTHSKIERLKEFPDRIAELNKEHFHGAGEVVRDLTEKIEEIYEKYKDCSVDKDEIQKDIDSINNKFEKFAITAGFPKEDNKAKDGVRMRLESGKKGKGTKQQKYENMRDELIEGLKGMSQVLDKAQNFGAYKDDFFNKLSAEKKQSIGDWLISKIKKFLDFLGIKFESHEPDHKHKHEYKKQGFVDKITKERQKQHGTQKEH